MSHYYLAAPSQIQEALEEHCASWDAAQAALFKKLLQDFLDGPAAIARRIRIDVKDPVVAPATIGGEARKP